MGDGEVVNAMGQWIVGVISFQKIYIWSKTSYSGDKWGCHRCGTDQRQGKIELLREAESRNFETRRCTTVRDSEG